MTSACDIGVRFEWHLLKRKILSYFNKKAGPSDKV